MKKLTLIIALTLGVMSCKKEEVTNTTVTNYHVTNYVSAIPMYSVLIHGDTLTADAEGVIYEYLKDSETTYKANRVYWKPQDNWTTWSGGVAYFQNQTLYLNF
jgi:hypothetical protein